MVEANTVFQNSEVNARVKLARVSEINYVESGSVANDLAKLRNPGNGVLAQAHQLRDSVGADLVCLVTETGNDYWFYGLQGPSDENAFSIIRQPFLTGGYYFPVVLSFNFGCQLERPYADSVGAFPYAYGYAFWTDSGYLSTVEAFSGQRIPYFSNPDLLFDGVPIGMPAGSPGAADNALVMNQTAPTVAAFRGQATLTFPPSVGMLAPLDGQGFRAGTNIILKANAADADGKVVRVDYYAGTNLLGSSSAAPFQTSWAKVPMGKYTLFAVATDNSGASTISDTIQVTVAPGNDDFVARARLAGTSTTVTGDNTLATAEPGEPDHAGFPAAHSLWWTYAAPVNGVVLLDATASSFPASLDVYTGDQLTTLSEITSSSSSPESAVRFQVTAGQMYQIAVDGPDGQTGSINLRLSFAPLPPNDNFAHRRQLSGTMVPIIADNSGATRQAGEPDHSGTPGCASLWWTWTAPADGALSLTATNSSGQTMLVGVYTGNTLTDLNPVALQFQYPSSYVVQVEQGVAYQMAVDSPNDPLQPGPFELLLSFTAGPQNDQFAHRTMIHGAWISLTNSLAFATMEPGSPVNNDGWMPSLWWSWTAPASGYVSIGCPSGQYLDVFTGTTLTNLTEIAGGSAVSFETTAGTAYVIAASGLLGSSVELNLVFSTITIVAPTNNAAFFAGTNIVVKATSTANDGVLTNLQFFQNGDLIGVATKSPFLATWTNVSVGSYTLTAVGIDTLGHPRSSPPVAITVQYAPPPNDDFFHPTVISGTWVLLTNSDYAATSEPGEPAIAGTSWGNSIWWSWTAPVSGSVTLSTPTAATALAVFTGNSVSNLTPVTGGWPTINFAATAGTTYDIAAAGSWANVILQLSLSNLRIDTPVNGAVFVSGANIPIIADVTATEQPVSQVEFFQDGVSISIANSFPYTATWTNVPGGTYNLTAVATDSQGHTRASPAVAISARPANDDFVSASVLAGEKVHTNGSIAGATSEPGEPYHDGQYGGHSVWYSWTAPDTDRYSVVADSFGQFAILLAIYTGSDLTHLSLVCSNATWRNTMFEAQAGINYFIAVDTTAGWIEGDFALDLLKPPANDNFAERIPITDTSSPILGTNLGASWEPGEPLVAYYGGESIWWSWTPAASGRLTFSISATELVPMLHIYTGSRVSNLALLPGQIGGPWDEIEGLTFNVVAGTNYAISADEKWNTDWSVNFSLNLIPYPSNDNFANSLALTGTNFTVNGDNTGATVESGEPNHTWGSPGGHSVWYNWTAPARGFVTLAAASMNSTPVVYVYTGTSLSALSPIGTNSPSGVSFIATAGNTYQIAVDGSGGVFTLSLSMILPPGNDDFETRFALSGMNPTVQGTSYLATFQPGEPGFFPWIVDGSVWYSWVAPADGTVWVHCPSCPAAVYIGTSVSNLTVVAPPNPSSFADLAFTATTGTEYEIAVAGASWLTNPFTLSLIMPKAQITSPTNESAFPSPASFEIVARTIDLDGAVVSVSFFDGTNLLGTVTKTPFRMNYLNVPDGSHLLTVQSTDQNGQTTTSEQVEVRVQPPNDDFAQRIVINGTAANWVADNSGATTEPGEFLPGGASGRTLWWSWTAPTNGSVTISTAGFSPAIAAIVTSGNHLAASNSTAPNGVRAKDVITTGPGWGPPGPTTGPLVAIYTNATVPDLSLCASNSGWFVAGGVIQFGSGTNTDDGEWYVLPSFTFPVAEGQTYQISLDGVNGSFGFALVSFAFTPATLPPVNDNFSQRTMLLGASPSTNGSTAGASREPGEPSDGADANARTVWYSWTAPATGVVQADASGDSSLAIAFYVGTDLATLIPVTSGFDSSSFYALAGITYQMVVAGPDGLETSFTLSLQGPPASPTINQTNTFRLANGAYQVWVIGATGQSFIIQASSDWQNWVTIRTDTLVGSSLEFIDTTAATFANRYYRVVPLDAELNTEPFAIASAGVPVPGSFSVLLSGTAGQPFRLQRSTNLMNWEDVTTGILTNQLLEFLDDTTRFDQRFYRGSTR